MAVELARPENAWEVLDMREVVDRRQDSIRSEPFLRG